ncbi:MAG: hypothetical protein AB7U61_06200, partial [Methylocystis sp.]
ARLVIEQLPRVEQFVATVKLRGWICNRELVPTEFDELEIDGRIFSVTRLARIGRPDVAEEFDQKGQPLVGFELEAIETNQRNAASIFRWGKRVSKVPLRSTGPSHSKINIIARTTHQDLRGHIDHYAPLFGAAIELPSASDFKFSGRIDVELPSPANYVSLTYNGLEMRAEQLSDGHYSTYFQELEFAGKFRGESTTVHITVDTKQPAANVSFFRWK